MLLINIAFAILATPAIFFILQLLLGLTQKDAKSNAALQQQLGNIKVLIPAHNEFKVVAKTLDSVLSQGVKKSHVLVVADNCTDNTFEIAQSYGVEVIERKNDLEKGKGFALAFGLQHLFQNPPNSVLILDADCILEPNTLQRLLLKSDNRNVVQAKYLIQAPPNSSTALRLSEFFFLIKNHIRPLGLNRLGVSVPLTGSGMLFPWQIISNLDLATEDMTEDTKFGLDVQLAGTGIVYEPNAAVLSQFPEKEASRQTQVTRWERGNISLAIEYVPKLMRAALTKRRGSLFGSAVNLCIPPLTLLVIFHCLSFLLGLAFGLASGSWFVLKLNAALIVLVLFGVVACWATLGRHTVSIWDIASLPIYLVKKIPLYISMLRNRKDGWIKTERD